MYRAIFLGLFIWWGTLAWGQIGINVGYLQMQAPDFEQRHQLNENFLGSGISVGLDYWFRLKRKRLEFTPELNYTSFSGQYDLDDIVNEFDFKQYGLFLNTNIYPLDFANDCDCPTFSKQNDFFKKGFFIQISPSITMLDKTQTKGDEINTQNDLQFGLGLGAGIDIGLLDLLTITPLVRYTHYFEGELPYVPNGEPTAFGINNLFAGVRVGIRWKK